MMKYVKLLAALTGLTMIQTLPVQAKDWINRENPEQGTSGNFSIEKYSDHIVISGWANTAENPPETLIIPSEIDGLPVREIKTNAFGSWDFYDWDLIEKYENIKTVVLPESMTTIGRFAFSACENIEEFSIPDSVYKIGLSAFSGTKWMKNQPEGVVYAGKVAYCYAREFGSDVPEEIRLKEDTVAIAEAAFSYESGIDSYDEENQHLRSPLIIPKSLRYMDLHCLDWSHYESLVRIGNLYYEGSEDEWNQIEFDCEFDDNYMTDEDLEPMKNSWLKTHPLYFNTAEATHEPMYTNYRQTGDLNGDSAVDILDVIMLNKAILGKETLSEEQQKAADIDQNGIPASGDALTLLKYIVGMDVTLPETAEVQIDLHNKFAMEGLSISDEKQELLNQAELSPKREIVVYDRQSEPETVDFTIHLSDRDIEILEEFAAKNFSDQNTLAEKLLFTHQWIHYNTDYAYVGEKWDSIEDLSYVDAIFNHRMGQCVQYNGAMAAMLAYYGFDVYMVKGWIGQGNQHFWTEVRINGKTYEVETGNYGKNGSWQDFFGLISNETEE